MAFPQDPLDLVVELAIGADIHADPGTWSWTDVSVREAPKVTSTRGRRNRIGNFPPTRVTATADNTDGSLCRHNPLSPHFGLLKKNTPMRVRINNGSGYQTRAAVYVPGFPPSWDPSEQDQTVVLSGVGITDRLGRSKPLRSALYRTNTAASSLTPVGYWTMEDGSTSTKFASETVGQPAAIPELINVGLGGNTELPRASGSSNIAGSAPCALLLNDNGIRFEGGPYTDTGSWTIAQAIYATQDDSTSQFGMSFAAYTATHNFQVQIFPGSGMNLFRITSVNLVAGSVAFTVDDTITYAEVVDRELFLAFQSNSSAGGTFTARLLDSDGTVVASASTTGTGSHGAYLRHSAQVGRESFGVGTMALAHVGVYTDTSYDITTTPEDGARAAGGWVGEMAHERVERLCTEERVPVTVTATSSQAMGPQSSSRLLDLLRECANADVGLLFEDLNFGLTFVSSSERYNLDPSLTLQYDDRDVLPPFEPADDDQDYYNQVTASRPDGSSATEDDSDEIDAVGQYADQVTPNVETDDQLRDIAGWRLNLGLNDELTWPNVRPNFYASSELRDDWMLVDIGDVVHITGHPSPLAPDAIRQIVEGYTEVFGSYVYDVTVNLSPASPWDVAELDDDALARLGNSPTEFYTDVDDVETTWLAVVADGAPWFLGSSAPEFPMPIKAGGLTYQCSAIAGPAFVAAGTAAHADNASVTPGLPAGMQAGDLMLIFAAIRSSGTGTVNAPAGYSNLVSTGNIRLMGKVHSGSESAPTVTFTGGAAGDTTSAQMAAFRRMNTNLPNLGRLANATQLNGSAQDIAVPEMNIGAEPAQVAIYCAWKQDDWTSVTPPSGATEIGEPSSTTGNDQGITWAYRIMSWPEHVRASTFTVTGGGAAISRALTVSLAGLYEMTVTRLDDDKGHSEGDAIDVANPLRLAL